MKRMTRKLVALAVGVGIVWGAAGARAQEGQIPKPTPEHERLAKEVGTWDATIKGWMQGPQSEPTVSQGVEKVKLMPGGLWILSEFDGKFGDMAFHGCGASGYDTLKKKYVGTWVDSMSTSVMTLEGEYDESTKTMTMNSKGVDPAGKPWEAKTTSTQPDNDTRVFTMLMKSDDTKGEYVKMMEISYKRQSK
jgi:hypothetical protein